MFEIGLVLAILAGATFAVGQVRRQRGIDDLVDSDFVDPPCPWCRAQTREEDSACPSCHQEFGAR